MKLEDVIKFAAVSPNEWHTLTEGKDRLELQDIEKLLNALAVEFGRASEYVIHRGAGVDHDRALEESNKMMKKVRKVLGYTYP